MIRRERKGVVLGMMTSEERIEIENAANNGMTLLRYNEYSHGFSAVIEKPYLIDSYAYWIKEWDTDLYGHVILSLKEAQVILNNFLRKIEKEEVK